MKISILKLINKLSGDNIYVARALEESNYLEQENVLEEFGFIQLGTFRHSSRFTDHFTVYLEPIDERKITELMLKHDAEIITSDKITVYEKYGNLEMKSTQGTLFYVSMTSAGEEYLNRVTPPLNKRWFGVI